MNRRAFLASSASAAALLLAGCVSTPVSRPQLAADYGEIVDAGYTIPAVPIQRLEDQFKRQIVRYPTSEEPGTIIVDTPNKFLYYILPGGEAVRYGIGVGREGFAWQGEAYVSWKQAWPKWHPPKEMIEREPYLEKYADGGMEPGLTNPLGARALYLYDQDGNDTLYRLHGTPEWNTIGTAASSGCIRLMNQDIIDLYDRVQPGRRSKVVVLQ
ncbi:L,D-transpeptidase [Pararhizobium haloflavum]|uniref:L,D-transpeptidase n=1 Tax=Pararhizobium haloflavum TaxID=2037914 RepID=UPI000C179E3C|nr:L,D-transpeptidase [Pararhizobium haloflavum]